MSRTHERRPLDPLTALLHFLLATEEGCEQSPESRGAGLRTVSGRHHVGGVRKAVVVFLRSGLGPLFVLGVGLQHEFAHPILCGRVNDGAQ